MLYYAIQHADNFHYISLRIDMIEQRKSHRIRLSTKSVLSHNDVVHNGRLENISMNGALIRLEHGTFLPQGCDCDLTVYINDENLPLQLGVEVVCVSFAMAGVKFLSYKANTEIRLARLMETLSVGPDISRSEHEKIRRRLADNLREE